MASRGALVTDWLVGQPPDPAAAMNPFNLWLADAQQLSFVTNHPEWTEHAMPPGIHGLANGARGDRWFKTARLESALAAWLGHEQAAEVLFAALADRNPQSPDPEDAYSSVFIANPDYGTRCSSVILVDMAGRGRIIERSFDASAQQIGEVRIDFDW